MHHSSWSSGKNSGVFGFKTKAGPCTLSRSLNRYICLWLTNRLCCTVTVKKKGKGYLCLFQEPSCTKWWHAVTVVLIPKSASSKSQRFSASLTYLNTTTPMDYSYCTVPKKKNFWSLSSYQAAIRPTINRRIRRGTSPTSIFYIVLLWLRRILAWGLLSSRLQHARISCRRPQQFIRSSFYRIGCLCGVSPFFCSSPVSYWFRFHSLFGLALAQTWVSVKAFVPLSYTDMCTRWMYFW